MTYLYFNWNSNMCFKFSGNKVYILTDDQEEDASVWLQQHKCLRDHKRKDYRDKPLKDRLYSEKAEEYKMTVKCLRGWWRNVSKSMI